MGRSRGAGSAVLALAMLAGMPVYALAQQATLSGRVTEQGSGQAIEGAQVHILGTPLGQLTSADGRFVFRDLPPGTVHVRVLRVPYQAQTRSVTLTAGQTTTADFALERAVARLEQVVTTVTGEQREVEVGNVIERIDAAQVAREAPVKNIGEMLAARAPGVQVITGNMTGTGSRVRIRGTSSLSLDNDPIYIIDGIRMEGATGSSSIGIGGSTPSRVNDINPDDIESIEVVKGPSAATLYGTDAANGVVVIKTKRGGDGPARWNLWVEQGAIVDRNDYPTAYTQFGTILTGSNAGNTTSQCWNTRVASGFCRPDSLLAYNLFDDPYATPLGTGYRRQYGASVHGGAGRLGYFVSGEAEAEDGIYKIPDFDLNRLEREGIAIRDEWANPNALRRANGRANLDFRVSDDAGFRISTNYIQSEQRLPQTDNNVTGLNSSAYGGPGYRNVSPSGDSLFGYRAYTPGDIFQHTTAQHINRFIGGVNADWQPLAWLTTRANTGIDFTHRLDTELCRFQNCADFGTRRLGFKEDNRTQFYQYTMDVSGTGTFQLTPSVLSRTTLGTQFFRELFDRNGARGEQLPPGAVQISDAALLEADETTSETRTLGLFLEQAFDVRERLFVTLAVRADDNSAFGAQFGAVYYPKASVSWVVSDEEFFPAPGWLDQLRLRAAAGASGNQPGTTDAIAYFGGTVVTEDGEDLPGVVFTALGNPDLKPERSQELELGADLTALADRLSVELTYYDKRSKDALIERVLPPSLGVGATSRFENLGEVRNWGFEGLVTARLFDRAAFGWEVTLNGSTNSNELVSLGGVPPIVGATTQQREGYPLNGYWQRPILSFDDANDDGIISPTEVVVGDTAVFLGYSQPRHEVVLLNSIDLFDRLLRISLLVDYKGGHKLRNGTERIRCDNRINCRGLMDPSAPLWEQARSVAMKEASTRTEAGYTEDGEFIRFRELSVTATLPDRLAERWLRGRSASVTFAGRNLGIITDYTGIDPESNYAFGDLQTDFQTAPPPSYFTVRVNLGY